MFTRTPLRVEALEDRATPSTLSYAWLDPSHLNVTLVNDGAPLSATYGSISQVLTSGQQVIVNVFLQTGAATTQVASGAATLTSAEGFAGAFNALMSGCFIGPGPVDPNAAPTPATTSTTAWSGWLSSGLQSLLSAINSYGQPSPPLPTAASTTSGGG